MVLYISDGVPSVLVCSCLTLKMLDSWTDLLSTSLEFVLQDWLKDVCEKNKWSHRSSPIIWRELLDRGGKGLLLGGYNEFLEHAQVDRLVTY